MKNAICFLILFLVHLGMPYGTSLCSADVADSNLVSYYPLNEANDSNVIFDQQSATKGYLAGTPYYLMACHNANLVGMYDSNNLYLLDSNDGKAWRLLNGGSSYHESTYQFRDPSIFKHTDGYYYCAYTNNNFGGFSGNRIGIIKSTNKTTWSFVTWITFTGAGIAWAPEWYVDSNNIPHLFVTLFGKIVETYPTNAAFTTWSTPVDITITGIIGLNRNPIDPFVVKIDSTYYLWYAKNGYNWVEYATSTSLLGPYTVQDSNNWAGWGPKEGECLQQLPNGKWRIYLEPVLGAVMYSDSTGTDFSSWGSVTACTKDTSSIALGHGTVIVDGSGRWTSQHTTAGQVGTALRFNGTTDYIDTCRTFIEKALTLNCWLDANDGQPAYTQKIFSRYVNSNNHFEVFLKTNGLFDANCVVNGVSKTVTLYKNAGSVSALPDGVGSWTMLTAVMPDCNISGAGNLLIGSTFNGAIDDVRIYNKALTQEEITAIYNDAGLPDNTAPTPNPMTWAIEPNAISSSSITMTATTAADISGVEYYFANITDPNHDSNWVVTPVWTDTGLVKNTTYTYRVKARDMSTNHNETGWSGTASDTTLTWACTSSIASDIDGDCQVNLSDFVRMADAWAGNPPSVDLNHDGKLDFKDLAQFAIDWLTCNRNPTEECWQ
jgi:hypothetical protein